MSKQQPTPTVIDELQGSEQHLPLKNRPGEKGDPNHMESGKDGASKASDKDDQADD